MRALGLLDTYFSDLSLSLCSESGAIIEHLLHTYAKQPPKWSLEDSYGSHFAEGSLMLYMQMTLMLTTIKAKDPQEDKVVKNSVSKYSQLVIMARVQSAMDHVSPPQADRSRTNWLLGSSKPSLPRPLPAGLDTAPSPPQPTTCSPTRSGSTCSRTRRVIFAVGPTFSPTGNESRRDQRTGGAMSE